MDLSGSATSSGDVPALASAHLLATLGLKVGDSYITKAFGPELRVRFVGEVQAMPAPFRVGHPAAGRPGRERRAGRADRLPGPRGPRGRSVNEQTEWWAKAASGTTPAELAARYRAVHNGALIAHRSSPTGPARPPCCATTRSAAG